MRLYEAVDPEKYAAMAAQDARASGESALQQQMRALSRSGASISSGQALALRGQYQRALAVAQAAAQTSGRLTGMQEQLKRLGAITEAGNTLLGTGKSMFDSGVAAEGQGIDAQKATVEARAQVGALLRQSADIFGMGDDALAKSGALLQGAADVEKSAADVLSQQASAERAVLEGRKSAADALATQAGISESAARLGIAQAGQLTETAKTWQQSASTWNSYLSNLEGAYNDVTGAYAKQAGAYGTLASSFASAADYYARAAQLQMQADTQGGGGGSVYMPMQKSTDLTLDWWPGN